MSVLRSLPVVIAYVSVHSYLVIGMLLRIVGLKECELGTQSLGLYWPLSEVGTGFEQQIYSIPHRYGPSLSTRGNLVLWSAPVARVKPRTVHHRYLPYLGCYETPKMMAME